MVEVKGHTKPGLTGNMERRGKRGEVLITREEEKNYLWEMSEIRDILRSKTCAPND